MFSFSLALVSPNENKENRNRGDRFHYDPPGRAYSRPAINRLLRKH